MANLPSRVGHGFRDDRLSCGRSLLDRVLLTDVRTCLNLGRRAVETTELLVAKFPGVAITNVTEIEDVFAMAGLEPDCDIPAANVSARKNVASSADLIFSNGGLQWVSELRSVLSGLVSQLNHGGCLAIQVPDTVYEPVFELERAIASEQPWSDRLKQVIVRRAPLAPIEQFFGWLSAKLNPVEIWESVYLRRLDGFAAIVDWMLETDLSSFLDPLDDNERVRFLARYQTELAATLSIEGDGTVLLRDRRLFVVGQKTD